MSHHVRNHLLLVFIVFRTYQKFLPPIYVNKNICSYNILKIIKAAKVRCRIFCI